MLSYYATHPQSYYRTGVANPDFPGIARFMRQQEEAVPVHVHFTGAGGNVGAGKYNDGEPANRGVLAARLSDGLARAWQAVGAVSCVRGGRDLAGGVRGAASGGASE